MVKQLDPRIFNRCEGYWQHAQLTPQAVKAWTHLLAGFDPAQVLDALDTYAAEGHTRPPIAGQLAARVNPPKKREQMTAADRQQAWADLRRANRAKDAA